MTRIDDKILLRRYHEEGDLQAREQLIEQYMSLVRSLARRYAYRGAELEDLVQIGAIGLIKAIDRFDIERGVELTTYATPSDRDLDVFEVDVRDVEPRCETAGDETDDRVEILLGGNDEPNLFRGYAAPASRSSWASSSSRRAAASFPACTA